MRRWATSSASPVGLSLRVAGADSRNWSNDGRAAGRYGLPSRMVGFGRLSSIGNATSGSIFDKRLLKDEYWAAAGRSI